MGKRIIALVAIIIFGLAVFITASYLNTSNKESVLDLPSSHSSNKVSNEQSNKTMNNDISNQNIRQTNIEQTSTTSKNNQNQLSNNSNIRENNIDETNISNAIAESQRNPKNQSPYNKQNAYTIKNEATKDSKIEQNTQGGKKPIETSLNDNIKRELTQDKDKIKQNEKIQIEASNNDKSNIAAKDSHHSYRSSNQTNKDKNDKSIEITQNKAKSSKDSNSLQKHSDIQDKNQETIKNESLDKLDKDKQTQDNVVIELDSKDKEIYSNKLAQNKVKEDSKDKNQNDDILKDETSKQKEVANKDFNEDNVKENIEEQRQDKTGDNLNSDKIAQDKIMLNAQNQIAKKLNLNNTEQNKAIGSEKDEIALNKEGKEQIEIQIQVESNEAIDELSKDNGIKIDEVTDQDLQSDLYIILRNMQNKVKEDSKDKNQNDDILKDETSKQKEVANKDFNEDNVKENIEEQRQDKTGDNLNSDNAIKDYISESKANDLDSNKAIENEDFKKNENKEQNELIIGLDSNNQIKDEINEKAKELNLNQAQNKESYIKKAQKENLNYISEIDYNEIIQSLNTDYDTSQQYYKCDSMPRCNDRAVIQKVIISSIRSHAKARYKEELAKKGEQVAKNFIELWDNTSETVIPKLTSHVSDVREQSFDNNKLMRICKARYYTEVLEDFGNGWSDKKGDKSPMYEASYRITCNNDNLIVKIVSDTIQITNKNKNPIKSNQSNLPNKVNLPLCTDDIVYKKLALVSMNSQAQIRAKEEMRRNGKQSLEKFMQLWEKTQSIIYNKIVSRIENIQSKGLDNNAKSRICSANYYTEVLEDFGNGWSDKKGDKSAKYEIYFTIRYIDEDESDVTIKILSQNKMRRQ